MTVPSRADSCPGVRSIVVGTAGHVDHGKSALIRALTGTDPDRLAEEKRKKLTKIVIAGVLIVVLLLAAILLIRMW